MAKTLKDLFLAALNATLILIALCLVLLILLVNKADSLTATFAEHLNVVSPLRDSIQETGTEIAGLRTDLTSLRGQADSVSLAALARIENRVVAMETRVQDMQSSVTSLAATPQRLLDHAIEEAADQAVATAARLRNCTPADVSPPSGS